MCIEPIAYVSALSGYSLQQRFGKNAEVPGRSRRHADAAVQGGDARHADKDAAGHKPVENVLGLSAVAAAIDGDEIGG